MEKQRENRFPRPRSQTGGARQHPPKHPKLGLPLHPLGPLRPCRLSPRAFGQLNHPEDWPTLRLSGAARQRRQRARRIPAPRSRLRFTRLRILTPQALRDHPTACRQRGPRGTSRRQRGGTSSQGLWYSSMVALAVPGGGAKRRSDSATTHWPPGRPRLSFWPRAFVYVGPAFVSHWSNLPGTGQGGRGRGSKDREGALWLS